MSKRTAIELAAAIVGIVFCFSAATISKLMPAPDIGPPLKPGTMFVNLCTRWAPPECFRERVGRGYLVDEPYK